MKSNNQRLKDLNRRKDPQPCADNLARFFQVARWTPSQTCRLEIRTSIWQPIAGVWTFLLWILSVPRRRNPSNLKRNSTSQFSSDNEWSVADFIHQIISLLCQLWSLHGYPVPPWSDVWALGSRHKQWKTFYSLRYHQRFLDSHFFTGPALEDKTCEQLCIEWENKSKPNSRNEGVLVAGQEEAAAMRTHFETV